jgi:hypothetical protein
VLNATFNNISVISWGVSFIGEGNRGKTTLQLPMQSVPITTKVVSSNPVHGEVYSIQHSVVLLLPLISGFPPVSFTNKTDPPFVIIQPYVDIVEITLR